MVHDGTFDPHESIPVGGTQWTSHPPMYVPKLRYVLLEFDHTLCKRMGLMQLYMSNPFCIRLRVAPVDWLRARSCISELLATGVPEDPD